MAGLGARYKESISEIVKKNPWESCKMTFGNNEFTDWAKSFSGFDGGNPQGNVWLCGIEYGGGESLDHAWDLRPISAFPCVGADARESFIRETLNIKFAKIYAALLGRDPSGYRSVYEETRAFDSTSDCCKLNLYPVAFKNVSPDHWGLRHYEITGFPTKNLYMAWCQSERFAMFKALVQRHNPRVILGFGKSFWADFKLAFGGAEALFQSMTRDSIDDRQELVSLVINDGRTLMILAPFPQWTLRSDAEIQAFGSKIRDRLQTSFGEIPLKYLAQEASLA